MLEKIGKYEIRLQIGRGAMGVVYEGFDPVISRRVAIKTLRTEMFEASQLPDVLARFKREAQSAGGLAHPHIVTIFDYGEYEGTAYIVMEYIKGSELGHELNRGVRYPLDEIVRLMTQLLGALATAHENKVVHRDLKPANMFVLEDGSLKVVDFGIAHVEASDLTDTGAMLGTPAYMSPEQCLGTQVDHRSDLFSAGVILYQLLTGDKPFTGSVTTIIQKVLRQEPMAPSELNPTLSDAWDKVVARAMSKKPDQRYQSARQFSEAIKLARESERDPTVSIEVTDAGRGGTLAELEARALNHSRGVREGGIRQNTRQGGEKGTRSEISSVDTNSKDDLRASSGFVSVPGALATEIKSGNGERAADKVALEARPKVVGAAVALLWGSLVLSIPATYSAWQAGPKDFVVFTSVFTALLFGLSIAEIIFVARGHNWARMLAVISSVLAFGTFESTFKSIESTRIAIDIISLLGATLLGTIAVLLLFTWQANAWFRIRIIRSLSAEKPGKSPGAAHDIAYSEMSVFTLAILSLFTLGLYQIRWFYVHWKTERDCSGAKLSILARAFCAPLTAYDLFLRIGHRLVPGSAAQFDVGSFAATLIPGGIVLLGAGPLAAIYVFLTVAPLLLPPPYFVIAVANVLPLLWVQATINRLRARSKTAQKPPRGGFKRPLAVLTFLVVIFLVGGVVAVANSAYKDYSIRSQVTESFVELALARVVVEDHYRTHRRLPESLASILTRGATPMPRSVKEIGIRGGDLFVVMAIPSLEGRTLMLKPRLGQDKILDWKCVSDDIPDKYLPPSCR